MTSIDQTIFVERKKLLSYLSDFGRELPFCIGGLSESEPIVGQNVIIFAIADSPEDSLLFKGTITSHEELGTGFIFLAYINSRETMPLNLWETSQNKNTYVPLVFSKDTTPEIFKEYVRDRYDWLRQGFNKYREYIAKIIEAESLEQYEELKRCLGKT